MQDNNRRRWPGVALVTAMLALVVTAAPLSLIRLPRST
jgi:hypothetical protein